MPAIVKRYPTSNFPLAAPREWSSNDLADYFASWPYVDGSISPDSIAPSISAVVSSTVGVESDFEVSVAPGPQPKQRPSSGAAVAMKISFFISRPFDGGGENCKRHHIRSIARTEYSNGLDSEIDA